MVFIPALIVLALGVIAFLVYVALKPADFRIERTLVMQATPETIFALIDDLHGFNRWNPFAKSDPDVRLVYSGPARGVGAAYDWSGKKSGVGRMQIAESIAASLVVMQLDFSKPLVAHNQAEFTLTPSGSATAVSWAMTGTRPFSHKLMGTLFNMDKMVGGEFAKGLIDLKTLAESSTR